MTLTSVGLLSNPVPGQLSGVKTGSGSGLAISTDGTISLSQTTGYANVRDFGAIGDGVADDTAAINAAIASTTGVVFFPAGNYLVSTGIVVSKYLKFLGSGFGSRITYSGSGTLLTLQYSDFSPSGAAYEIESLSFYNTLVYSDCCIELAYLGPAGIAGSDDKLTITNVYINTISLWYKGLFLNRSAGVNAVNFSINNINNFIGEETPGVYGIHALNDLAGHNMIRTFSAANLYILRFNRCIYFECLPVANAIESLYIANAELLGNYGIYVDGLLGAVGITNTHMSMVTQCFYGPEASVVRICGCDWRPGRDATAVPTPAIQIGGAAPDGQQFTIVGNTFVSSNNVVIQINGGAGYIVQGNNFLNNNVTVRCVEVNNSPVGVIVSGNNVFSGLVTPYVNNSSGGSDITIGVTGAYAVSTKVFTMKNGIVGNIV